MNIKHILLGDYEFNVNKEEVSDSREAVYNSTFGYGISYPDEVESETSIYLRLDLEFNQGERKLYSATGIYQLDLEGATIDNLKTSEFHILALKEVYEKFSTLHNISISQTPFKNAFITDDVLNGLEEQIKIEENKANQ